MKLLSLFVLMGFLATLSTVHAVGPLATLATVDAAAATEWFIFGDSYTQTLFNQSLTQPNDANPFGNPALPGHTACGAVPNYVYYAAIKYNTSVAYAYNFARGGATINATLIPPSAPTVPTIVGQVDEFEQTYAGPTPLSNRIWTAKTALFSVWIGINDVGDSYLRSVDQSALHDALMDSYFHNLQRLYDLGARKFLILNVPPTDRSPLMLARSTSDQEKYRAAVHDFNAKLVSRVSAFKQANPQTFIWTVDTNFLLTQILDNPQQYGFVDAVSHGTGDNVVWCGTYHISPHAHDYVAQKIHGVLNVSGLL